MRSGWHSGADGSIDELIDRAVLAINRGDRGAANALAEQVLAADRGNVEAEDVLAAAPGDGGEVRRLTIVFADLVDSTVLSTRLEPEPYRLLVGGYRDLAQRTVDRYEGHIASTKGDGLLVVFGYRAGQHNDARRAVQASLEITREVRKLSEYAQRRFGVSIAVRAGVHRGLVYSDRTRDDVYGLAVNLATRVSGLAPPGTAVVSHTVEALVRDDFELEDCGAAPMKDIEAPITHYRVLGERAERGGIG
jgi:adenylate cyclase